MAIYKVYECVQAIPELYIRVKSLLYVKENGTIVNETDTQTYPSYLNLDNPKYFKPVKWNCPFVIGDEVEFYTSEKDYKNKKNHLYQGYVRAIHTTYATIESGKQKYEKIYFKWMKRMQFYFFINSSGKIMRQRLLPVDDEATKWRKATGNFFNTHKEAEIEKQAIISRITYAKSGLNNG